MSFSTIIHRDFNLASRVAVWVVVTATFVASSAVPVNADLISVVQLDSPDRSFFSDDNPLMSAEQLFGIDLQDRGGCGPSPRSDSPSFPSVPIEPVRSEFPLVGFAIPGSTSGTGAGSDSSTGGNGSSVANAILCWLSELPPPTLVGYLYPVEALDIPPAPPFELLRPPRVLTILA